MSKFNRELQVTVLQLKLHYFSLLEGLHLRFDFWFLFKKVIKKIEVITNFIKMMLKFHVTLINFAK